MTERTPSTRAGRDLHKRIYGPDVSMVGKIELRLRILEVEAEARADALREVGERLEAMPSNERYSPNMLDRADVLAVLREDT